MCRVCLSCVHRYIIFIVTMLTTTICYDRVHLVLGGGSKVRFATVRLGVCANEAHSDRVLMSVLCKHS